MKKYIIKLTTVILFIGALTSCEDKEVIYDGSPVVAGYVTSRGQLNVLEDQPVVATIEVQVSALSNVDRAIVLSIDPSSTAMPNQYKIDQASLIIPANKYYGKILVSGDFATLDGEAPVDLILDLKSVGDSSISIDAPVSQFTLTIQRSCPFDVNAVGTSFTSSPFIGEDAYPDFVPVMVKVANLATYPNAAATYSMDTLWGLNFVGAVTNNPGYNGQYPYAGYLIINQDLTVTILGSASWATGGSGSYNPCTNVFTYTLSNGLFTGTPFLTDVIMNPN